jgi:hypothetical protein
MAVREGAEAGVRSGQLSRWVERVWRARDLLFSWDVGMRKRRHNRGTNNHGNKGKSNQKIEHKRLPRMDKHQFPWTGLM